MESTLINLVLHEIDIIIQKKFMMVNYNTELEDRRVRLMELIQNNDDINLSERGQQNLLQNVSNMKMEVLRTRDAYKPSNKEI